MTRGPEKQFDPEIALTRAMEVFWAQGYEGASVSQLLHHMGISKKSLYDTYGNKRSLFLKALDHYTQTITHALREQLVRPGSPRGNLQDLFQEMQRIHGQPGSHGCMLGTNLADFDTEDPEMAQILKGHLQQLEQAYRRVITQAQAQGELDPNRDPEDLARLLLCVHQGMALMGRVQQDDQWLAGVVRGLGSVLE